MKRYETYKDSGLQWLGEIPEHWKMSQMKRLFSFGKGLSITKSDLVEDGVPVISYGQIHSKKNSGTSTNNHLLRYVPKSFIDGNDNSSVSIGDFIFADTSEDIEGCGNCVYIDREGVYAGYHAIIAKSDRKNNKFFAYLFLTDLWRSQIRSMVYGVKVYSITKQILSQVFLFVPPIKEQEVIVNFLDSIVGKIDCLISAKEKQVEDLQQYRSSVISEAVTCGLHPEVEFKDSGIEWIGKIPFHWDTYKLKYLVNLQSGTNLTAEQIQEDGLYPVYGGNGLRGYYNEFSNDGLFILIGRQGALCGNINYTNGKFWATEHAVVCYPKKDFVTKWLGELLRAMNLNQYSESAAQPGLSVERIKQLVIPVPPIFEQQEIADYLDNKTSKIDATIQELNTQIEDLRQYKKSVISEAVTGKVDLRNWKPK